MTEPRITVYVCQPRDREYLRLEYTLPGTHTRKGKSAGTSDRAAAERARADWEYELNHGLCEEKGKLSWARFRERFFEEHAGGLRPSSREKYVSVFNTLEEEVRPEKLSQVTGEMLSRFHAKLRKRKAPSGAVGLAAWTRRNYLVALKKALAWAVKQKLIASLPEFPEVRVPKLRPRPIPEADWEKLFVSAPDDRWRAFLLCGWQAGLRLNEALQLRRQPDENWPWLDEAGKKIILPARFVKSGEDQWVPLHPTLLEALEKVPREEDGRAFVFRLKRGGEADMVRMSQMVGQLAKKVGVKLTMHTLRRGFGCRVAQKLGKGNAPILHRLMRHSSMQVTMDFYANCDDVLQDAIEGL